MLGTRSNLYIRSLKTGERRNQRKTERNFLICIANGSTRRRHLNSTFGTICIHLFEVKICDILIIQTICRANSHQRCSFCYYSVRFRVKYSNGCNSRREFSLWNILYVLRMVSVGRFVPSKPHICTEMFLTEGECECVCSR